MDEGGPAHLLDLAEADPEEVEIMLVDEGHAGGVRLPDQDGCRVAHNSQVPAGVKLGTKSGVLGPKPGNLVGFHGLCALGWSHVVAMFDELQLAFEQPQTGANDLAEIAAATRRKHPLGDIVQLGTQ
ncbi:hypothetical protein [uncultured Sphingomonas sp.]|uniref:hypothetical protein n=1 Tax=uncultured Sphingomonas sp. TaxID=158754 RepID=UPI0025EB9630|nr:hypothetical protein [uncultured Sphingomonas sp.]